MKTQIKNRLLQLTTALTLGLASHLSAQTFRTLYNFTQKYSSGPGTYTNSDGAQPFGGLVSSGGALYGTAAYGGPSAYGTVFKVKIDGTGFTNLSLGCWSPLIGSGDTLYGIRCQDGSFGYGSVASIKTDGTAFTTIYNFTVAFYDAEEIGLLLSSNTLYGGQNTLFSVNTDGTGFTTLYSFTGGNEGTPYGGLVISGTTLYGTTYGGSTDGGTVFSVNTDGTGFTTLYSFTPVSFSSHINSDGARPYGRLVLSGTTLYGTAAYGGSYGYGTVFSVNTHGTAFTTLHSFSGDDGAAPENGLTLLGDTLYGSTTGGVLNNQGNVVFSVNTSGTAFKVLHSFTPTSPSSPYTNSDGLYPSAALVQVGNALYGTAYSGGAGGNGTVFSISFAPEIAITPSGTNTVLSWPTNFGGFDYTGFTLQSATNLGPAAVWTTNSAAPVVVNGQNTVTNPHSATQQFFRLSQ